MGLRGLDTAKSYDWLFFQTTGYDKKSLRMVRHDVCLTWIGEKGTSCCVYGTVLDQRLSSGVEQANVVYRPD
jgi:hypothetical protein